MITDRCEARGPVARSHEGWNGKLLVPQRGSPEGKGGGGVVDESSIESEA